MRLHFINTTVLAVWIGTFLIGITLFSSCKKQDEPTPATPSAEEMLIGLWGVYTISTPEPDNQYTEYLRFGKDHVLEHFAESNGGLIYSIGTYRYVDHTVDPGTYQKTNNGHIEFNRTQTRTYIEQNGKLIFLYSPEVIDNLGFIITEQTENRLKFKNQSRAGYMHAVKSLPDKWEPELYAPEVQPTEQNLLGRWEHTNLFINGKDMVNYWYFDDPAVHGITYLPDNEITDCNFWIDYIWAMAVSMETIEKEKNIYVNYYDCSWQLTDGILPLTCSRYSVGYIDASGKFIKEDVISSPIKTNFNIEHMTDHYLILKAYDYEHKGVGHFVFHKTPNSPSPARVKQGITHTPFTGQYHVQEMKTCEQWKK